MSRRGYRERAPWGPFASSVGAASVERQAAAASSFATSSSKNAPIVAAG